MPEFTLHTIDVLVIAAYAVFVIWLGIYLSNKHGDAEDYFLAGRKMIWPFIGVSLFASNISSTTLIGLSGDAYSTGISVFNYEWMASVVLVFFAIFILPFYLRSKIYTVPEYLEKRFDSRSRYFFSILTLFGNIVIDTAGALYAGGLVMKLIFPDIPMWQSVSVLAILAGIYTIAGGLAAVIYTDFVQTILLLLGSVVVTVLAFDRAGGWDAIRAATPPEMLSLVRPIDDPSVPWLGLITGVPLLGFYFWCTNQFMVQRVLSAKNIDHGRWGSLFAAFLKLPVLIIMVLPGTAARLLYPDLENPDQVFPVLIFDHMPVGLLGLLVAGLIAALMSSIDSTLNSASTLVTMDFVKKFKPEFDNKKKLMKVGRIVTFIFMIFAAAWAPQIERFGSLFKYLQTILAYTVTPVVAVFILGIFWKRANGAGAFAALSVGLLSGLLLFVLNMATDLIQIHFLHIAPILFLVAGFTMIIVSLMTAAPDAVKTEGLMWRPQIFKDETRELQGVPVYLNYRYQSVALLVVTAVLVGFFW